MVAAGYLEQAASVGKFPLFYVFDPGSADPERHLIFGFTGDAAGVTANTGLIID
jgi:hypothetical protein